MGMYDRFQTDKTLETKGIVLDYDSFRVTVARAGGANDKYRRIVEAKLKPFRRAIQTDNMSESKAQALIREAFAESVILNWEIQDGEDSDGNSLWKQGIEAPDGGVLPFNVPNVILTLTALPDLFADIREQASQLALFRASSLEEEAKN